MAAAVAAIKAMEALGEEELDVLSLQERFKDIDSAERSVSLTASE